MSTVAQKLFGSWLPASVRQRLPGLREDFDQGRTTGSNGSGTIRGREQGDARSTSGRDDTTDTKKWDKPVPALKPSHVKPTADRQEAGWLVAQRDAALARAVPDEPKHDHGPVRSRGYDGPSR